MGEIVIGGGYCGMRIDHGVFQITGTCIMSFSPFPTFYAVCNSISATMESGVYYIEYSISEHVVA